MRAMRRMPSRLIPILFGRGESVPLQPVELTDTTITGAKRNLTAGRTLVISLLSDLQTEYPDLRRASQLTISTATLRTQYYQTTYTVAQEDYAPKTGYTYYLELTTAPATTLAGIYYNHSEDQFYIKEAGVQAGSLVESAFTPRVHGSTGEFIGLADSDANARLLPNYDSTVIQTYFSTELLNGQIRGFRQHSANFDSFFVVADSVGFLGTFVPENAVSANTLAGALEWIEANNPNPNTNYAYYNSADVALYDIAYTAGFPFVAATIDEVVDTSDNVWLTARTAEALSTYFSQNTYDSTLNYYYYDAGLGEVRHITGVTSSQAWVGLQDGQDYDEVENSEITIDISDIATNLEFDALLASGAITENKEDLFRFLIELGDGTHTANINLPIDFFLLSSVLDGLTSPQTAMSRTIRQGASESSFDLVDLIQGLDAWDTDITLTTTIEYQATAGDNTSWTELGVAGFEGLLPSETTLRNISNSVLGLTIQANAVDHEINNRLRIHANLEDTNMAMVDLYIPFNVDSLVDLSSLPGNTNVTARTYREGAGIDTMDITDFLSGIDNWGDIHIDSTNGAVAEVQVSTNGGTSWVTHASEQAGLTTSEYTLDTSDLQANGNLGFRLHAGSIFADIVHDDDTRFRIYITLTEGTTIRYVSIPLSLRAPVSLADLTFPQTASTQTFREGADEVRLAIADHIAGIADIDDLNLEMAVVTVEYQATDDDDTTWTDLVGAAEFMGLAFGEFTIDNDIRADSAGRGEVGFRIHPDTIGAAITSERLRIHVRLTDGS